MQMERERVLAHARWCIEQMAILDRRAIKTGDVGEQYDGFCRMLTDDLRSIGG